MRERMAKRRAQQQSKAPKPEPIEIKVESKPEPVKPEPIKLEVESDFDKMVLKFKSSCSIDSDEDLLLFVKKPAYKPARPPISRTNIFNRIHSDSDSDDNYGKKPPTKVTPIPL
jgi:hypothetical protein